MTTTAEHSSQQESDTRRKLRALIEQGFTVRECAGVLGVSVQRVYYLLKRMGLQPNGKGPS